MGKSTFINKIFKECDTNNSCIDSTIGLNIYTFKGIKNFAILDSAGDSENEKSLEFISYKGYIYSKMLFYLLSKEKDLDSDSLRNNKYLNAFFFIPFEYSSSNINSPYSLYSFPFPLLFPFKYSPSNSNLPSK